MAAFIVYRGQTLYNCQNSRTYKLKNLQTQELKNSKTQELINSKTNTPDRVQDAG